MGIAIAYVAGTAAAFRFIFVSPWVAAMSAVIFTAAALLFGVKRVRGPSGTFWGALVCIAVFWTAWLSAGVRSVTPLRQQAAMLEAAVGQPVIFRGIVVDDVPAAAEGTAIRRFHLRFDKVRWNDLQEKDMEGRVAVFWYSRPGVRLPRYGEEWNISGILQYPWGLSREEVSVVDGFEVRAKSYRSRFISEGKGVPLIRWCLDMREAAAGYLSIGIDDFPDAVAVLRALLFGYRQDLPRETRQLFRETGTLHIFAISGLHVGLVAGLVVVLARSMRIPRMNWAFFVVPAIILYTLCTGAKASAVRACIMATVYLCAPCVRRRLDAYSAVAFAAIAILVFAPRQIRDLGFILSFVVVLGLIGLTPRFLGLFEFCWKPDPFRIEPEGAVLRMRRGAMRMICSLFALSCAAWISSAPLTAYYFGRVTPSALLCNVVIIPLTFLIILAGALSLVFGCCFAFAADIFNHANLALLAVLVRVVKCAANWPLAGINVPRPPAFLVCLWYAVLGGLLLLWRGQQIPRDTENS